MKSLRASITAAKMALRGSFEWTPRTLGLVFRSSPSGTVAVGSLSLLASLLPLAVAYVGKRIVDAVVAHSASETLRWVTIELGCVAAISLASQGLMLVRQIVVALVTLLTAGDEDGYRYKGPARPLITGIYGGQRYPTPARAHAGGKGPQAQARAGTPYQDPDRGEEGRP